MVALLLACGLPAVAQSSSQKDHPLTGVWGVEKCLGPLVRGTLTIDGRQSDWRASIAGFSVPVEHADGRVRFVLPAEAGEFRGTLDRRSDVLDGEWIQPAGIVNTSRYATPVRLKTLAASVWRGDVVPLDERISLYVSIQRGPSGALKAVIVNPEYNLFRQRSYQVTITGSRVTLSNPKRPNDHFTGIYDNTADRLFLPLLSGYPRFALSRRAERDAVGFYARTPVVATYTYRTPLAEEDGWATASLADVGIAGQPIAALVEKILTADPTDNPVNIDSLLIARHGKLVLEEYFHGFTDDRPHDMRSASKTFAPVLAGIARDRGARLNPSTPVAELFPEEKPFAHPDVRKDHLTLQALMTMTSGLSCDDNDNASPGNENTMQTQAGQPDWYKYTLDLPMIAEPGGKHAVYCSADLNLMGGAVSHATHSSLPQLFDEYLARPLQFHTYHMNLMPTGEAYMGGGLYLRPRDELKLGQLYLSGGVWNNRRVLSKNWIEQSMIAYSSFDPQTDYDVPHRYGFGWHINDLHVGGRVFRAYSAGGNGGQIVMLIPELDMVVGFNGSSYGEFTKWYRWGLQLVPQYIIPAALGQDVR